jgi:uncharacterized protein YkwD
MKKKSLIIIVLIGVIFLIAFFLLKNQIFQIYSKVSDVSNYEKVGDLLLKQIEKTISTPPPLKYAIDDPQSFLTKSGVLKYTNEQRINNGLKPLIENSKLDASAKLKVEDMFKNQYFEHVSPTGVGVSDLAQQVNYEYIIIGENLALGNFENSQKLVEAWMASPGHRENILNSKYQEIGIAVMEGTYQDEKVWMAVQHFASSMANCIKPNENLKIEINAEEEQIQQLNNTLNSTRTELENAKPKTREEVDLYNQQVEKYNSLLGQYNFLVDEVKKLINNYNNQVEVFNGCLR